MWCVCLFLGPPIPFHLVLPKHATPFNIPSLSPISPPRRRLPLSAQQVGDLGELGHTLLATVESNPNPIPIPIPKQQQQKQEEGEESQLSGSDVLLALQRATSRKKNKNKLEQEQRRRRVSSSVATPREQTPVDYTNVPPLCIKPHWAAKLDELEKRLHDLSDNI